MKLLTWYTVSLLASIHVIASLELVGVIARFDLRAVSFAGATLALVAYWIWGRRESERRTTDKSIPDDAPLRTIFIGIAAVYALGAATRLLTFPLSFDGNSYHLPLIAGWLQSGSLALPAIPDWRFSLPANGDCAMLPWLASGWPSLTITPNIVAAFLAASACFVAARRLTGHAAPAYCSAALFLSLPMVFFQTLANSIDLFGAAFLLTALSLIIELASADEISPLERRSHTLTAAAALGIAGGSKTTLLVYVACTGFALLLVEAKKHVPSLGPSIKQGGLILAAALLPSLFWFARAGLSTGNPLYPVRLSTAVQLQMPGFAPEKITPKDYDRAFVDHRAEWWIQPWREWRRNDPPEIPYAPNFGLGMAFAAFAIPGAALCLFQSAKAIQSSLRRTDAVDWTIPILCLSMVALTALWALTMNRVPRFLLPVLGMTCILAAPLFNRLWNQSSRVLEWFVGVSVAAPLAISLLVVLPLNTWVLNMDGVDDRAEFYGIPLEMSRLPAGSVIANLAPSSQNYPLMGDQLQYKVLSPIPHLTPEEQIAWMENAALSADFLVAVAETADYVLARKKFGEPSRLLLAPPSGDDLTWALWSLR